MIGNIIPMGTMRTYVATLKSKNAIKKLTTLVTAMHPRKCPMIGSG